MTLALISFLVAARQTPVIVVPPPPAPNQTVETVNGQAITSKELEPFLWDWYGSQVEQVIATLTVIDQAASQHKVAVTEKEIEDDAQKTYKQTMMRAPSGQDPNKWMKDHGAPISAFRYRARMELLLEKLAMLDFKPELYVKVSRLVIQPKDETTAGVKAAATAADEAEVALQKGEPWASVVARNSTNPQTAANHGELGWLPIAAFPQEVQQQFATMKLNTYTKPVSLQGAWQIFLLEVRGKDASPQEIAELKQTNLHQLVQDELSKLQKAAKIETMPGG